MPFSHTPKNPGDLIKSDDWNKALNGVADLFTKFTTAAAGHSHSGTGENGPQITEAGLGNNSVSNAKLQNNAVTAAKILDGTITAAKMVPGVLSRDIGIAITTGLGSPFLGNPPRLSIPLPTGFVASECVFFFSIKYVACQAVAPFAVNTANWSYNVQVDTAGLISLSKSDNLTIYITGIALAKRGGW